MEWHNERKKVRVPKMSSAQYWMRKLKELMDGAKPMTTRPMPKLVGRTKESYFDDITIVRPMDRLVSHERLNQIEWWDLVVADSGYDEERNLLWVVLKSAKNDHQVQIIWCRKPRRGDYQSAHPPTAPAPQESGARATAEV